jgi:hypothetical protein
VLDEWSHVQSKVRKGVIDTGWLSPVPWQLGRVFFIISLFLGFRFRSCVETVDPGMSCVCVCMYVTYAAVGLGGLRVLVTCPSRIVRTSFGLHHSLGDR